MMPASVKVVRPWAGAASSAHWLSTVNESSFVVTDATPALKLASSTAGMSTEATPSDLPRLYSANFSAAMSSEETHCVSSAFQFGVFATAN